MEETGSILEKLRKEIPVLKDRYKIKNLGLFGSYVRGEQKKGSDVDILIEFEVTPTLLEFIVLEDELSEIIGLKVDLVMKDALKPRIGKYILNEVVYA